MYYKITSITSTEVILDLRSEFLFNNSVIKSFVFDNPNGVVWVIPNSDAVEKAFIRYRDIDYFEVKTRTLSGNGKNFRYDVVMNLKDLSNWNLIESTDSQTANVELNRLVGAVQLGNLTSPSIKSALPSLVEVIEEKSLTTLKWRNPVSAQDVLKFVGVSTLAVVALGWLINSLVLKNPSAMGLFFVLIFVGIFILAVVSQTKLIIKDKFLQYGFSFSPDDVSYFEESVSTGKKKKLIKIPINEWFGLSFSGNSKTVGTDILMLSMDQYKNYLQLKKAGTSPLKIIKALEKLDNFQRLRFKALHVVQRLAVVNWIAEASL